MKHKEAMVREKRSPFFYGWVIVAVAFVIMAVAYGVRYSFSVFYVAILEEFGWSRASTAAMFSLNILAYGITAPVAGGLVDRFGPRVVLPIGAILLAAAVAACSQAYELWHLYILYGVIAGCGIALVSYPAHVPIIVNWFIKRRGAAMGLALAGIGVSHLFAPIAEKLIENMGWRASYLALGIVAVVIIMPVAVLFQRMRPEDKGLLPYGASQEEANETEGYQKGSLVVDEEWASKEWTLGMALKTGRLWLLFFASICFWGLGVALLSAHQVVFTVDVGYTKFFAASIFSLYGIMYAVGNSCGFISDRIGRENTYMICAIGAMIGISALLVVKDASHAWLLYVYAISFGWSSGLNLPTMTTVAADLFQGKGFGAINGFASSLGFGVGGAIGPWLGGYIFDVTGSYSLAFTLSIVACGLACVLIWIAGPRKVRLVRSGVH